MDYNSFKEHLVTFLWRTGDTQLINSLDTLIRMADGELSRRLLIERRHSSRMLVVDRLRVSLPDDYYSMRYVSGYDNGLGEFKYVTPAQLQTYVGSKSWVPFYSIEGSDLLFAGPAVDARKTTGPLPPDNPQVGDIWNRTSLPSGVYIYTVDDDSSQWVQLTVQDIADTSVTAYGQINVSVNYRTKLPDFQANNASWLADEYLDLYTYATLKQSAAFLREDERIQTWGALFTEALDSANEVSAFEQAVGTYASKPLPRAAGIRRRR